MWLSPGVAVDWQEMRALYREVLGGSASPHIGLLDLLQVSGELLPDWYEDWVLVERERFRQLRLHALEILSIRFTELGLFWAALEAGLAAVAGEPLRESAHRTVVIAHLAEGNRLDAEHQFNLYRDLLRRELGIEPSASFTHLLRV